MRPFKLFLYNFLIVFFTNYVLPGIEITDQTKIPHIGSDLLFSGIVALLNLLILPILKALNHPTDLGKIALISCTIAFGAYTVLKFAPLGIEIKNIESYFLAMIVVAIGGFLINLFEMRKVPNLPKPPEAPRFP